MTESRRDESFRMWQRQVVEARGAQTIADSDPPQSSSSPCRTPNALLCRDSDGVHGQVSVSRIALFLVTIRGLGMGGEPGQEFGAACWGWLLIELVGK
jgi:hypothetical protein